MSEKQKKRKLVSKFFEDQAEEGDEDEENEDDEKELKGRKGGNFFNREDCLEKEFYTKEDLQIKTQRINDKFCDELLAKYQNYKSDSEDYAYDSHSEYPVEVSFCCFSSLIFIHYFKLQ